MEISRGVWKGKGKDLEVVAKSLMSGGPQDERVKLLQEAVIMGQFHHPNILQFFGVVKEENRVSLATQMNLYLMSLFTQN